MYKFYKPKASESGVSCYGIIISPANVCKDKGQLLSC